MNRKELHKLQQALKTIKESAIPDTEWVRSDRGALLSYVKKTKPVSPGGFHGAVKMLTEKLFLREAFQFVRGPLMAVALVLLFVTGGSIASVSASERSLPGDLLYPLKIAAEQTRLVFTSNKSDRLKLKTEFVERRVQEIKEVAASDTQDKSARVKLAAENLKQDLNTVNHQLDEVRDSSEDDSVAAAKLLDEKSTEMAKTLKSVRESLPSEARASLSEAEVAAVNTSVKAVGVLIESKTQTEEGATMESVIFDDDLTQSLLAKMDKIDADLSETADKFQASFDASKEGAVTTSTHTANTPGKESTQTQKKTNTEDTGTDDKSSIEVARQSLDEARQLLENNQLNEIPEKLLLAVKAARQAEREAVKLLEEAPPPEDLVESVTSTSSLESSTGTRISSTTTNIKN